MRAESRGRASSSAARDYAVTMNCSARFALAFLILLGVPALHAADGTVVLRLLGSFPLRSAGSLFSKNTESLPDVALALRSALTAAEPRVVLLLDRDFTPGLAAAEELAAVIRDNKGTKTVACLLDAVEDNAMVVAAACDEVAMVDGGLISVDGLALSGLYFADALAKLGLNFHAVTSGPYKTAPEALTRNGPSPAGTQERQELATALDTALIALSTRPGLDALKLTAARAQAPQTSALAVAGGLVQTAVEPGAWLAQQPAPVRTVGEDNEVPDLSSLGGMMAFWRKMLGGDDNTRAPKVVAVVELEGEINEGADSSPGFSIAPGDTVKLIDRLADDARVVAVVVRVNSPGGSAGASDRIHRALKRLDAVKPVVALFDGVAASGGYYIGCAARKILVHRTTITGSIGVFGLVPDFSGTLALLGVHRDVVTTGPRADLLAGAFTPDKEAAIRQVIDDIDRRFQSVVALNRHLPADTVAKLAGGRVFTGDQAIANGLADGLGSFTSAVALARELAGEKKPLPFERLPRRGGFLARFGLGQTHAGALLPAALAAWIDRADAVVPSVLAWSNFSVR